MCDEMKGEIIREEQLKSITSEIEFVEGEMYGNGNHILLKNMSAEQFVLFCVSKNTKVIFYSYEYFTPEAYLISDEVVEENAVTLAEKQFCRPWVKKWNENAINIDFSCPIRLTMGTIYNDVVLYWSKKDSWSDSLCGENNFLEYMNEHENQIIDTSENDLEMELEQALLDNETFRNSTNQKARKSFIDEFLDNPENKKYLILFKKGTTHEREKVRKLYHFSDRVFEHYKFKCRMSGLNPGDPLPK